MLDLILSTLLPSNENLIQAGGLGLIAALVFIETGLLIGLLVPGGETLLFTAGLLCGMQTLQLPVVLVIICLIGAAIAGDGTGFFIGSTIGERLHQKKDTFIFKQAYLRQAEDFYHTHGKSALILGRFLPIVRTFNPLISGTGKLPFGQFMLYTVVGCVLYISSLILAGYFLGRTVPDIKNYIGYILPAIILLALFPVIRKFRQEKRRNKGRALDLQK